MSALFVLGFKGINERFGRNKSQAVRFKDLNCQLKSLNIVFLAWGLFSDSE